MSAPLSEQQLAEIRLRFARANASRALLGSTWTVSAVGPKSVLPPTSFVVEDTLTTPDVTVRASVGVFGEKPLAAFVAAARSDVPALLAEVDRLQTQVADVRAFAVSHEYRWLLELLDGYGTHGGVL